MNKEEILGLMQKMTLRQKIYQTVICHADEAFYNTDKEQLKKYAEDMPFGGFFLGEEIIGGNEAEGEQIKQAISEYSKVSSLPPIFCADTEYGCGYMFKDGSFPNFPWQMTLGASDDEGLAYEYGKNIAISAKYVGVNLSLSPVADINMNWLNPVVNTRAISDKPEAVKRMISAMVDGMQEYGLGATAKHFPGDGTDYRDQHYVLTVNKLKKDEWDKSFGMVYRELIKHNVASIMVGHISFPNYQKERIDTVAPPSTLSYEVMTKLLKEELGYNGVVMTDALCMNGFRATISGQVNAEIEAFKSGADILLWPSGEYVTEVEKEINSGIIPIERLNDAVFRILNMKNELGLFGGKEFKTDNLDKIKDFDTKVSEAGVTLVRDRHNELPCRNIKKVIIIGITEYDDEMKHLDLMKEEFEKNNISVVMYHNECSDKEWSEADMIIYATFCHEHKPCGFLDIQPSWQTLSHEREKAVICSFGSPYLINTYFPTANKAIALYSDSDGCMRTAVNALIGKIPFKGNLPVTLQNSYNSEDC